MTSVFKHLRPCHVRAFVWVAWVLAEEVALKLLFFLRPTATFGLGGPFDLPCPPRGWSPASGSTRKAPCLLSEETNCALETGNDQLRRRGFIDARAVPDLRCPLLFQGLTRWPLLPPFRDTSTGSRWCPRFGSRLKLKRRHRIMRRPRGLDLRTAHPPLITTTIHHPPGARCPRCPVPGVCGVPMPLRQAP